VPIDDAGDPRIADYVNLRDPSARRRIEGDEFLIAEGVTVVRRLLRSSLHVRSVLVTPKRLLALGDAVADLDAPVYVADPEVLAATVGFDLHRGAVAAADRPPSLPLEALPTLRTIAVLEGLNDHENLGAIARSARALGVDAMLLDPTSADPYYRRAVRVSMGEILALPIARASTWPAALSGLRERGVTVAAMTPAPGSVDIDEWQRPDAPLAILLGAEGPGLSAAALDAADVRLRIPIAADVDSLNVGHAAAVAFALLR
jgi:tRNA G18 (ribose-2'-O)-methylase SpoU